MISLGKGRGIRVSSSSSYSSNTTNDGVDELNGTSTPEEESVDKNPQDVLVIPFGPNTGEFVGLLSEQKVYISFFNRLRPNQRDRAVSILCPTIFERLTVFCISLLSSQ